MKTKILYHIIKRFFDIVCALIGCVVLLPIIIVVKVVYLLNGDFSSIFYTQERVGKNGKVFKLYKFRTMVTNSAEMLDEMLKNEKYLKEWKENQKFENDPRITKIGGILRKTSLDEMPQFLNVLKNDMSMIGPRPLIPGELEEHNGNAEIYQSVKPGVTGWWAVNGRSATNYDKRLELEYYYVKNCSIMLDIKCMFMTVKAVVSRNGAK